MPRKGSVPKRTVLPDPVYGSVVFTKLVNQIMLDGKKSIAENICYGAFDIIKEKFSLQPGEMISFANCAALLSNREEYLKNSPEKAMRVLFINKCDLLADNMINEISEKLLPLLKGYDHLVMGSLKMNTVYWSGNARR